MDHYLKDCLSSLSILYFSQVASIAFYECHHTCRITRFENVSFQKLQRLCSVHGNADSLELPLCPVSRETENCLGGDALFCLQPLCTSSGKHLCSSAYGAGDGLNSGSSPEAAPVRWFPGV